MNVRRRLPSWPRPGYTLIEILVVMAIIAGLAALAVLILPKLQDSQRVSKGTDIVQGKLFVAKQTALRDQLPRGVRLIASGNAGANFDQLQLIEQPAPYTTGLAMVVAQNIDQTGWWKVTFGPDPATNPPTWPDFSNGAVQQGDLLDMSAAGDTYSAPAPGATPALHLISAPPHVGTANWNDPPYVYVLTMPQVFANTTGPQPWSYRIPLAPPPNSGWPYRIIRAPRPMIGEAVVTLPEGIVVRSLAQGTLLQPDPFSGQPDILFDPSGKVLRAAGKQKIVLWVRDTSVNAGQTPDEALIAVYPSTGGITAQPVNTQPVNNVIDPYLFVKDGATSGM